MKTLKKYKFNPLVTKIPATKIVEKYEKFPVTMKKYMESICNYTLHPETPDHFLSTSGDLIHIKNIESDYLCSLSVDQLREGCRK